MEGIALNTGLLMSDYSLAYISASVINLNNTTLFNKLKKSLGIKKKDTDKDMYSILFNKLCSFLKLSFKDRTGYNPQWNPDFLYLINEISEVQTIRYLDMWLYQCNRGNISKMPFYKIISKIKNYLLYEYVKTLEDYKTADDGIN